MAGGPFSVTNKDGITTIRTPPPSPASTQGSTFSGLPPVYRGYMASKPEAGADRYHVDFAFNPSDVSTSFSMDTGTIPVHLQSKASQAAVGLVQGQSWQFSCLFDRSDDFNYYRARNRPHDGVLVDIDVLLKMVGVLVTGQPLTSSPITVMFGADQRSYAPIPNSLGPFVIESGYVEHLSIQYTHFSHDMIPLRARADLSVSTIYSASNTSESSGDSVSKKSLGQKTSSPNNKGK